MFVSDLTAEIMRLFFDSFNKKKLMDKELKEKVEKRLKLIGVTKSYLAIKMGISTSQLSQTFSGVRKLQTQEETLLRKALNL